MDSNMMADTRWRLSQASTSQILELLWQIWDLLNRKFRFADGPIRCRRGVAIIAATIHILYKKKKDMRGTALTRCFTHDFDGYQYL